jgi:dinuclear metal center YbgI/SA1388 family protein
MAKLEQSLYFLDETFDPTNFPDYPYALNGLQVQGGEEVERMGAAVDASEVTLAEGAARGLDLLLVHHGLFWDGLGPLTGPRFRKVAGLIRAGMGLYSLHLPLDAHPELGNNALLMNALGLEREGRFGCYKETEIGWWGTGGMAREELLGRLEVAVDGDARLVPGGPSMVKRVGVMTGGGSGALAEASAMGLDTLVTGEAPHHAYHDAMEMGVNLLLGGHYATETFGVKALAKDLSRRFDLTWEFLDFPTGL